MIAAWSLLGFVTLERLGELLLARRNTAALKGKGGVETGEDHYPVIVALHAAWLIGLWLLVGPDPLSLGWLAVFGLLQVGRLWVLATLKSRWTTRIIVVPGAPLVVGGPYRLMSHPNYAVVVGEIAVLPLVFGLTGYAIAFSILNAAVLYVRIRAESAALRDLASRPADAHVRPGGQQGVTGRPS